MKLDYDPRGGVDATGSAADLSALAAAITAGHGFVAAEPGPGRLAGVEVTGAPGDEVRIDVDAGRGLLMITGGASARGILAENIRGMAELEDGGHLHLDDVSYFFIAEGSVPLIVSSPLGGMPLHHGG